MGKPDMEELDLLRKTELEIRGVHLERADLSAIADAASEVLGLERRDVLVADYRPGTLVLDIHGENANPLDIAGREGTLLERLEALPGVTVTGEARVSSRGMLGWIAHDREEATRAISRGRDLAEEIARNVSQRVIVFPSGSEVRSREIEDTNTPAVMERLEQEGFRVSRGEALPDDRTSITARIREASEVDGYGVVVTTGGVGAEDKDQMVEAVLDLDPEAATPYVCRYEVGTGRHVKDGVRIAVGEYNQTLIVSLPGPNDEVRACLDILSRGLREARDKHALADAIAERIRALLRERTSRH